MESKRTGMALSSRLFWLVALLPALSLAQIGVYPEPTCDGSVEPLVLPYENVTINSEMNPPITSRYKCLAVQFGQNSKKNLCMGIGTNQNGTFVPGNSRDAIAKGLHAMCDPKDPGYKGCLHFRGGIYDGLDGGDSFTKDQATFDNSNATVTNDGFDWLHREDYLKEKEDPLADFPLGWDQISFLTKFITGFPFRVITDWEFPFGTGVIGFATESTFLKLAVKTKVIPTRAFGFDHGRLEETKGQLILGGYDSDKMDLSKATEFPIFPNKAIPCPLQISVKSMTWGKDKQYLDTKPFTACVEPAYHTTVMPLAIQQQWNSTWKDKLKWNYAGHDWDVIWYNHTNKNATSIFPEDDIIITLDNGLAVKIPPTNFWQPKKIRNETEGTMRYVNGHIQTRIGHGGFDPLLGKDPGIAFLGAPFLSQVYLAVNYETGKFYMQPYAKLRADRGDASPDKIKTLGCENEKGEKKLPTWAIAVIVLGGILAIIAVLLLALWLLKRAHRKRDAAAAAAAAEPVEVSNNTAGAYGYKPPPPGPLITDHNAYSPSAPSEISGNFHYGSGGGGAVVSPPTSPAPGSNAPAYSEIYGMEQRTSSVPSQAGGYGGNWSSWGSAHGSPGLPQGPTATGFGPVEMAGDERIAEMGSSPLMGHGAGYNEKM